MENDISRENQIKCQSKKTCTITEVFSGVFFFFVEECTFICWAEQALIFLGIYLPNVSLY